MCIELESEMNYNLFHLICFTLPEKAHSLINTFVQIRYYILPYMLLLMLQDLRLSFCLFKNLFYTVKFHIDLKTLLIVFFYFYA